MVPKYFDIHTHVNFDAFKVEVGDVVKRALGRDTWMIQVGTQKDTSRNAVALAESFDEGVYAAVGLHPIHTNKSFHDKQELGSDGDEFTSRGEVFDFEYYKNLSKNPKVVAIGECGLDYFRIKNTSAELNTNSEVIIDKQKDIFKKQVQLALDVNLPLMLHCRSTYGTTDVYKDILEILNSYSVIHNSKLRGNVHFFAGTWEEAKQFLKIGFTLSFTGVITFTRDYDEIVKNAPLEMIMAETDAPYVTPVPYRGKRNEPVYVNEVAKRIAEIRKENPEKVRTALVRNALRVFDIKAHT